MNNAKITNRISQILNNNRINTRDIAADIKNDTVVLNGYVDNRYELELAEELVGSIEGVDRVKNYLRTKE